MLLTTPSYSGPRNKKMRSSASKPRKAEPAPPGTPSMRTPAPPTVPSTLEHIAQDKLVWATQKLQTRLRKLVEAWRNRSVRRAEVVWRAGMECVRGMCYATISAGQLVADGVMEWTSMDGI